jgi:PAS domain S-box-containing protein
MTGRGGGSLSALDLGVRGLTGAVILIAVAVLIGWRFGFRPLQTLMIPGSAPMRANAAVGLMFAAVSLWMQRTGPPERWRRYAAQGCALLVLTVGALTLAEHLLGVDIGIDQLLFHDPNLDHSAVPGRMPPPAALSCVAIGCALVLLDAAAAKRVVQPLIMFSGLTGLAVLVGYVYEESNVYRLGFQLPMAVHMAAGTVLLSTAIALARPDRGITALLISAGPSGLLTRRLLPPAIALPLVLGWLCLVGARRGLCGAEFGTALFAVACIIGFVTLIVWSATVLQRADRRGIQAETAARQSEERFRLLIEGARDYAIFMLDPGGRVSTWNPGAERMKGYTAVEIIGEHIASFYPVEDVKRGLPDAELQTAAREGRFESEGWRVRKDGSRFWANAILTALRNEHGELLGFSRVTRDLTERKRAEDELRRTARELARSNAELEQFAYVASHDLQEPLRAVSGCVELLQRRYDGQLDARAEELMNHARDGAARMRDLINDLLAYSRVSTRGSALASTDCNMALERALTNLSVAIRESGAVITKDPLPTVTGDLTQVTQVLQNLLSNAIKFRGARIPEIHVGAERNGGNWLFSVRDNGIGMEAVYSERIFKVFQRLHTRREYAGTGIGLAICKKIIERHGGRIWVTSQPNEGSTFHFTIPERRSAS